LDCKFASDHLIVLCCVPVYSCYSLHFSFPGSMPPTKDKTLTNPWRRSREESRLYNDEIGAFI
jgi:hypothetical protein